jgi:hypothetical protein
MVFACTKYVEEIVIDLINLVDCEIKEVQCVIRGGC